MHEYITGSRNRPRWADPFLRALLLLPLILSARREPLVWSAEPSWVLTKSPYFEERAGTLTLQPDLRIHVNVPLVLPGKQRTRVIIYALPNGNSIEQTLGCRMSPPLDWHYDIQHVAAQIRLLRSITPAERLILVCAEAGGLSWPTWRQTHTRANQTIVEFAKSWRDQFGGAEAVVTLAGHSGGGSFLFGLIEGSPEIPPWIDRIALLDANYAFDAESHADKFKHWLKNDATHRLIVLAYDDRHIRLDGKRVVGNTGGTFRATRRMVEAMSTWCPLSEASRPPFTDYTGLDGRIRFIVHGNPENKILHTALIGEMNGLIHALTLGTPQESQWGRWGGQRAYERWVQPPFDATNKPPDDSDHGTQSLFELSLPPRPDDAAGGRELMKRLQSLSLEQREAIVAREILAGNIPDFLRHFKRVPLHDLSRTGSEEKTASAIVDVMCDYLAVGSEQDFVRVPLTPQTAQQIADRLHCILPTRKLVDAIDRNAEIQVEPRPLTEQRESVATFVQHQEIIESQCTGHPRGLLLTGIKKDVILSPRIFERPHRLAIYGWRKLDGFPIQNLTVVHVDRYVDYSHGVRLVHKTMEIDGQAASIPQWLQDEHRCSVVSDEGPMNPPRYGADDEL